MYKGVDTGERLIRLRPSGHIPPSLYIMGQRVTLRVLQPHEISCLRLRRRKSFRSQINLNIKLLDNDDILIEPVVMPSATGSEYHTMPSLAKRQQRVNPTYHSMPRMRHSPSPSASQGQGDTRNMNDIPDMYRAPRSSQNPAGEEPEYANIAGDTLPRTHKCKTIEIKPPAEQKKETSDHIEINVQRTSSTEVNETPPSNHPQGPHQPLNTGTTQLEMNQNRRPSLRLQMKSTLSTETPTSSAQTATSQVNDKTSVFDFSRKSSIKFERTGDNGSMKTSKIVHSPKLNRKLSVYNPPETPQSNGRVGESKGSPHSPPTSGNETASPQNEKKSPKRISKKSIKHIDGKPQDCSQSSSEGQESPTKHRKLLSMKAKKPVTRQPSAEQTDVPTSVADITTSERERSYSDSSSVLVTRRKMSSTGREGNGKVPWCGCWGNGCL